MHFSISVLGWQIQALNFPCVKVLTWGSIYASPPPPPQPQHMQEASLVVRSSVALAKPPELSRVSVSLTEEGMVVLFDC